MEKHGNKARILLEESRNIILDRPAKKKNEEKEFEKDKLFFGLIDMMNSRIRSVKPGDKSILNEKNQMKFRFKASVIEFDTLMLEVIMDEVPGSKMKHYLIGNEFSNLIIDHPGFKSDDYMKVLEKALEELEKQEDKEGRRLFKTALEMSKSKETASVEILFRVTPRDPMSLPRLSYQC